MVYRDLKRSGMIREPTASHWVLLETLWRVTQNRKARLLHWGFRGPCRKTWARFTPAYRGLLLCRRNLCFPLTSAFVTFQWRVQDLSCLTSFRQNTVSHPSLTEHKIKLCPSTARRWYLIHQVPWFLLAKVPYLHWKDFYPNSHYFNIFLPEDLWNSINLWRTPS